MLVIIIILSVFFIGMAYLITPKNANSLLAGYNTMSKEKKETIDIVAVIKYFKKFHIFLGISFFILGLLTYFFIGKDIAGIFLGVYPILAYIYFAFKSSKIFSNLKNSSTNFGIIVLIMTLVGVSFLFYNDIKDNKPTLTNKEFIISGSYGETILFSEIKKVELVNNYPEISYKSNGFALEIIKKGYFKTKNSQTIKLLINTDKRPLLLITKTNGKKIYYVSKYKANSEIIKQIKTLKNE